MTTNLTHLTSLGNLITALQTHTQAISTGIGWGNAAEELRSQVIEHLRPLEDAGLQNFVPAPFESLRRFAGGEEVALAELAAAKSQLEYVSSFLRTLNGAGHAIADQRLRRMTGPIRPSVIPPSFSGDPASLLNLGQMSAMGDVATKHVRAAILFTDFSQFSKQSRGMPSEYIIDRLNRYFEVLIPIAQKMGGIVNKLVGDAIMAFWIDSSNNSLKAVQAALAMQEATRNLVEEFTREAMTTQAFRQKLAQRGSKLADLTGQEVLELAREVDPLIPQMKVGINTGWVSYGRLGAKLPYYSEITVIGDAVNTAARMEASCQAGQICISQATQNDLPEGLFDLNDLGQVEAKNIGMVQAFGVIRENRLIAINGNGHRAAKTIHGRNREIGLLKDTFMKVAEESSPRFTMLMGAPGEGKSTVANHFLGMVKSEGFEAGDVDIVYARGEDQPELEPYQVIADALRLRAGVDLGSNQEEGDRRKQRQIENEMKVRALVESAFTGSAKDRDMAARLLGHFLGVPFEGTSDQMAYLLKNHTDLNTRMVETVMEVFAGLSSRRPLMLVVDDMQWTDSGTRNILHALATRLKESPIMILGLRRLPATDPFPDDEPDWRFDPVRSAIIDLNPLSEDSLEAIVHDVLGRDIERNMVRNIIERAANNPLFAREIAAEMKKGMKLDQIPTTVQDLFQAQMTRLPDEHLDLLKKAAIVGREFAVTDLFALGISEPDHLIPPMIDSGVISKIEGSEVHYRFQHDLRRESVLAIMDERERREIHALYGRQLIAAGAEDYANIAYHLRDGGISELAAEYFFLAGNAAANVGAFRAAATFYRSSFGLAEDPLQRIRSLSGWDEALFQDRNYGHQLPLLNEFAAVLKNVPKGEREIIAEAHYHCAQILVYNNRLDEAEREISEGINLYESNESSVNKCALLNLLGRIHYRFRMNYKKAREVYAAQIEAANKIGNRHLQAMATYNLAQIALFGGNYSEALAFYSEVADEFENLGDLKMYLNSVNAVATVLMMIGEYKKPLQMITRMIKLSRERMNNFCLDGLLVTHAEVLIALERFEEAIQQLEDALPTHEGRSANVFTSSTHLFSAVAQAGSAKWSKALIDAQKGLDIARVLADDSEIAKGFAILAQVYLGMGRVPEALDASTEAIKIYERIGTIYQFDEKLLLNHIKVLMAAEKNDEALVWTERSKRLIEERAAKITDEGQRKSFLSKVPETREIVRLWQVLREESSHYLNAPTKALLDSLDFYPPESLPDEAKFSANDKSGKISRREGEHSSAAGITVDLPLASILVSLLTRTVHVEKNPGEVEGVWARNIHWEPVFGSDGTLYSLVDWEVGSKLSLHKVVFPLIGQQAHRRELLRGEVYSRGGAVFIELKRSKESRIRSITGVDIDVDPENRPRKFQFGDVRFILVPTPENKTILVLEMGRGLYTQNPWNVLKGFVASAMRFRPVNGY